MRSMVLLSKKVRNIDQNRSKIFGLSNIQLHRHQWENNDFLDQLKITGSICNPNRGDTCLCHIWFLFFYILHLFLFSLRQPITTIYFVVVRTRAKLEWKLKISFGKRRQGNWIWELLNSSLLHFKVCSRSTQLGKQSSGNFSAPGDILNKTFLRQILLLPSPPYLFLPSSNEQLLGLVYWW